MLRGRPEPPATSTIYTTNGVPTSFWTDNGPVWNVNTLKNHALFVQDKFSLTSKLTLNYGLRFDQYHSAYPEQRFGLNGNKPCVDDIDCDFGPFTVRTTTPARDVVTFNTLVPRVALIYDVFGNSKTALKASWGRFSTNPAELISSLVNPIDLITKKYRVGQQLPDGGSRGRRNADHAGVCRDASADLRRRATDALDRRPELEGLLHR